ncbi:hypothetical protein LOTGIDRAFT_228077 [Lottia gigantea]|uniref:Uncharacterized protein n=1 Tax=Lottia gigantea TaxID=225164 RepID=V4CSL7_LOTGI|nr:hypothetical protein LOTGIDRAFT_228077 [Lottia gigantea]ESP05535.1 hypothetical protein LOTGIDRAFT_228077 [Lottia gigantea]
MAILTLLTGICRFLVIWGTSKLFQILIPNSLIIRERATGPLPSLEYLDLSNLSLVEVERLGSCKKVQYLNLHGNNLQDVNNLQYSPNLWSVNLSCNKLQCLDGLSRFLCFGELILSNNDLSWKELVKIRHIHILNLSLHGNPQLEKDQYYRIHVIDCLPNVWMLDGRIVTSAERIQVKNFFQDSALSEHPVRRKLTRDWFITSAMKNIELTGLFGQKAASVLTKFPVSAVHNIEMDKKRLLYLAYNLQEDMTVTQKATKRKYGILKHKKDFVEELLTVRNEEREKCNMLLIILVASLEFILPTHLVQETLEVAQLQKMGKVHTMDLFFLPRDIRCKVVSVLLSAVKIDKDIKENGGLYDKLYLCLFYTICELTKISQSKTVDTQKPNKYHALHKEYRSLLAAEMTQLLCIVPDLFDYVEKDMGIINILTIATGDSDISMILTQNLHLGTLQGRDRKSICEELSEIILTKVETNMMNLSNSTPRSIESDVIISKMKALPIKEVNLALYNSDYLMKGLPSPEHSNIKQDPNQPIAELGDEILLGPQTIGKIMSLPQPGIALISIDEVPVSNGSMESKLKDQEDHYTYINMNYLHWENHSQMWKPRGTVGDKFTIQSIESFQQDLEGGTETSNETYRPNSPAECFPLASGAGNYRPTEPLIYTPRQYTTAITHTAPNKTHKVPRPLSSVFKDKLDLKLDIRKRPKSAVALRSSSPRSQGRQTEGSHKMVDWKEREDQNFQNGDHTRLEGQGCHHGDDVRQKSNDDVGNTELKDVGSVNALTSSSKTKSPIGVFITTGNEADQESSTNNVDQYITNMIESCIDKALDSFREDPTEQSELKNSTSNEMEVS